MSIDLSVLGAKLATLRAHYQLSQAELSSRTGLPVERLNALERGALEPTGDEVLIFADHYKCDFRVFISNDPVPLLDKLDALYRLLGGDISREDRWALNEFLFLCEAEQFLLDVTGKYRPPLPRIQKRGTYYKGHGHAAASAFRQHLGLGPREPVGDLFALFRKSGLHVFRRRLSNSAISGIFIRHPSAGLCVLVNYDEDVYRQRFTAAHEVAHALLDAEKDFVVSGKWEPDRLVERRADAFAAHFLCPPEALKASPPPDRLDDERFGEMCNTFGVNATTMSIAMGEVHGASATLERLKKVRLRQKTDSELPESLPDAARIRKARMLEQGLTQSFVDLCFYAFEQGQITRGRLAEFLLTDGSGLADIATLFGRRLDSAHYY